jgi:hypothetical protein
MEVMIVSVKVHLDAYLGEFFIAESLMGQRWNGWAIPFFTKKQSLAAWEKFSRIDDSGATYTYDEENDEFLYEFEGEVSRYPSTRIIRRVGQGDFSYDGYSLGGWEWCWTLDNGEMEVE